MWGTAKEPVISATTERAARRPSFLFPSHYPHTTTSLRSFACGSPGLGRDHTRATRHLCSPRSKIGARAGNRLGGSAVAAAQLLRYPHRELEWLRLTPSGGRLSNSSDTSPAAVLSQEKVWPLLGFPTPIVSDALPSFSVSFSFPFSLPFSVSFSFSVLFSSFSIPDSDSPLRELPEDEFAWSQHSNGSFHIRRALLPL